MAPATREPRQRCTRQTHPAAGAEASRAGRTVRASEAGLRHSAWPVDTGTAQRVGRRTPFRAGPQGEWLVRCRVCAPAFRRAPDRPAKLAVCALDGADVPGLASALGVIGKE